MGFQIVIAGESQCNIFAEVCLVADHISQNLPNFCYECIEKPVAEWKVWLFKINQKNKWHHTKSPVVWKELLMKGSKPFYIGGACEFLEYCHSYYQFDVYMAPKRFDNLVEIFGQYKKKIKEEKRSLLALEKVEIPNKVKTDYTICISGAGNPLAMFIISGLFETTFGNKNVSKIYIYDDECSPSLMDYIECECNFIGTESGKIVKNIEKIGVALTATDLLIILDYVPFRPPYSIGEWLLKNKKLMEKMALKINASAAQTMNVIFPNLGPACYNATILANATTKSINKNNIVVVTSDIGLDMATVAAEIADVPLKNMFCPPVWGFVGINHLTDILTTIHKYESFHPYERFTKVGNSTLCIGTVTPELRTMEYLMYFDETLWTKVAERRALLKSADRHICINKAVAVLNLIKLWLFNPDSNNIVSLGIQCNGSFGLTFEGFFSQPAKLVNGEWKPARNYAMPKDPNMTISYLEEIAKIVMKMSKDDLPQLVPFYPCVCKRKRVKRQKIWI